jgi:hypothetical protein
MTGLSVAGSVGIGEQIGLVGHPQLMPLTLSRGELVGYASIFVLVDMAPCKPNAAPMYQSVPTPFGRVCVMQVEAGLTNVIALSGNSGSPMVNIFGNLVGVLFAASSDSNWGNIVPLKEVKEFLKEY